MQVSVKLDMDKVVYDKNGSVNLMATLEAPDVSKESKRSQLCVCAVIDRSGSMQTTGKSKNGNKMDYVKRSMYKMIDHMTEDDSLALVFFDHSVESVDFRKMNSANKEVMRQAIAKVQPRGNTDIGAALRKAGELFAQYEGGVKSVERIMLLTDGVANMGAERQEQFAPIVSGLRRGVSVSCFGYGEDFNEELLTGIAKHGKGNNYFIETPDSVSKVFAVELGGLLTCYAQEIVLSIKTHKGASVTNVLNDVDVSTRQDSDGELVTDVKVGDIYAGERRDIIVRIGFEKRPQALPRPITLADVSLSYLSMDDSKSKTDSSKVKVELVKTASEATQKPDAAIAEQVAILEAAVIMAQAKKMADEGQWMEAKNHIFTSSSALRDVGTEKSVQYACSMDSFADSLSADYSAGNTLSKGMGSFAYSTATRSVGSVGNAAGAGSKLQMNAVMSSLVDAFDADPLAADKTDENPVVGLYAKTSTSR